MKNKTTVAALVYVAFFAMIIAAMFITKTGYPLWALLLLPEIEVKE